MRLAILIGLIAIAAMLTGSRAALCRGDDCAEQYRSDVAFCHWTGDGDQAGDELGCVQTAQDDYSTCLEDSAD